MNTETLISTNKQEIQRGRSNAQSGKKEAERANCGKGVCEVAWKPFKTTKTQRASKKNSA